MASNKQYIVETTVHAQVKAGAKKVVLLRSPVPQDVPAGLVKELLASGAIKESSLVHIGGASGAADDPNGAGVGTGGDDDATGD